MKYMRKLNTWNIVTKQPYRSILRILAEFGERGLQAKHFRYCLMENHGLLQSYPTEKYFTKHFRIDKERLNELINKAKISPNCIKSNVLLSQYLNNLVKYKLIVKDHRYKKVPTYKFRKETGNPFCNRNIHLATMNSYANEELSVFPDDRIILYNLPKKHLEEMPEESRTLIKSGIHEINMIIENIETCIESFYSEKNPEQEYEFEADSDESMTLCLSRR
jgi:hypothetical protein